MPARMITTTEHRRCANHGCTAVCRVLAESHAPARVDGVAVTGRASTWGLRGFAVLGAAVLVASSCGTSDNHNSGSPSSTRASPAQVRDAVAGVAYEIPQGWSERPRDDLIDFFTSLEASASDEAAENDGEEAALVGAGLFKSTFYDPGRQGLRQAAVSAAQGFAEFFIPESSHDPTREDHTTRVDGHAAWRADYSVVPDDSSELPTTVTLIAVDAPTPFYLVAVRTGSSKALVAAVEGIFSSARLIAVAPPASSSSTAS